MTTHETKSTVAEFLCLLFVIFFICMVAWVADCAIDNIRANGGLKAVIESIWYGDDGNVKPVEENND